MAKLRLATADSYARKEDLLDILNTISPQNNPLVQSITNSKVSGASSSIYGYDWGVPTKKHVWQTDKNKKKDKIKKTLKSFL